MVVRMSKNKVIVLKDEEFRKMQLLELDMLVELDKVCRKHNIKYSMFGGTLLGAIRHKGFIPWDDDIDVNMPREDYEQLKLLRSEFEDPYFLQYPGCDKEYFFSYAKLRNSNTSGISSAFRYDEFNQGIWIDIFPMDNCLLSTIDTNAEIMNELILENSAWMRLNNPYLSKSEAERLSLYKNRNPLDVYEDIDRLSRQYEFLDTEFVTCATLTVYSPLKMTYRKMDINKLINIDLYGYEFPIPKNYDVILRTTYNDYMQFPPAEKRGTWHNSNFFNPDIPYKETLKMLRRKDKGIE